MKNNSFIIFIFAALLLSAVLVYFFSKKQPEKYVWIETLDQDMKQPYDYALLQEVLKANYDWLRIDEGALAERLDAEEAEGKAYIFVGHYPYHSKKTAEALLDFAERGGELVIISHAVPDSLMEQISDYLEIENYFWLNTKELKKIQVDFVSDSEGKKYPFAYKSGVKDTSAYNWSFFPDDSPEALSRLGSFADAFEKGSKFTNFVSIKIGKGHFYWHSNPILFTNLYLSKENVNGFEHLNAFLSHFKAEKWIWDYASTIQPLNETPKSKPRFDKPKTPMEYIFSQPALRWAWILLLVLTLFYALFGAKRRQQSIPIVETNRNTSLEFVNTIGRLYFQQQNHKVIFEKIMQLYRSHLRRRYGILLRDEDLNNEEKINYIVKRTDIDREIIKNIFDDYLNLKSKLENKNVEMSAETLNNFYLKTDRFYKAEEARKHLPKTVKK